MRMTAFVPARSGSKRLVGKNIKLLAGKPLILWTLEPLMVSKKVDRVIFSTDSLDYWELVKTHFDSNKLSLDYRSPQEAGDSVKIFDYLVTKREKIFNSGDEAFILTLPTVPFRTLKHIDEAYEKYCLKKAPIFSATAYGFPISFAFTVEKEGSWTPMFDISPLVSGNTRSQDQQVAFHPNGAIYIRDVADLANKNLKTLYEGASPYIMDRNASIDIDNETDFVIASAIAEAGLAG